MNPIIQIENGKLIVRNVVIDDTETLECFRDVKREDLESRFKLAVKVGIARAKVLSNQPTDGRTTKTKKINTDDDGRRKR